MTILRLPDVEIRGPATIKKSPAVLGFQFVNSLEKDKSESACFCSASSFFVTRSWRFLRCRDLKNFIHAPLFLLGTIHVNVLRIATSLHKLETKKALFACGGNVQEKQEEIQTNQRKKGGRFLVAYPYRMMFFLYKKRGHSTGRTRPPCGSRRGGGDDDDEDDGSR